MVMTIMMLIMVIRKSVVTLWHENLTGTATNYWTFVENANADYDINDNHIAELSLAQFQSSFS